MKIKTTKGEVITISKNDIIWNALDYLWSNLYDMDDFCLAMGCKDGSKSVPASDLQDLILKIRPKYA